MESSAKGRRIPHKSKKRAFPGDSSPGMEPETAEIYYPPGNRNPKCKTKMLKLNEGIMMASAPNSAIHLESVQGVSCSYKGKDHMDPYARDCVSYDEYSRLQSCFDNLDFPTGIEAPVLCFPDCIKLRRKDLARPISSSTDGQILCNQVTGLAKSTQRLASRHGSSGSTYDSRQAHTHVAVHPQPQAIVAEQNDSSGKIQNSLEVVGSSSSMEQMGDEDVIKKYHNFKKFDIVEDYSDHHFSTLDSAMKHANQSSKWAKKIQEEWRILEKDLPDMIFVRVYESRMDLLRAVIIGAEGTPYHDGLFFFDAWFPSSYPDLPPRVHYHSGGLRINPNLYQDGNVCLSLLDTWIGDRTENWTPGTSTMLQVLVSIQGLILNAKPYFNEPEFEDLSGSVHGENCSLQYNERTLIRSLKTMVYTMKQPPKHFDEMVIAHFRDRAYNILMACKAYSKGVRVGCLDKKDGESCSREFKDELRRYTKTLVKAFKQIGVDITLEFTDESLSITQKIRAFFGFFGI